MSVKIQKQVSESSESHSSFSQMEIPHIGQRSQEVSMLNANMHFPVTGISPSEAPEAVPGTAMRRFLRQCLCVLPLLK